MNDTDDNAPTLQDSAAARPARSRANHRAQSADPAVPRIGMIWARGENGVIGHEGAMPWHLPEDLAHFKRTTMGHPIVMGRRTWESIPEKMRPLPGRTNIVLASAGEGADAASAAGAIVVQSPEDALELAAAADGCDEVWIIGGGLVYEAFAGVADTAVVTVIEAEPAGDTHAPQLGREWERSMVEPETGWLVSATGLNYRYELWEKTK